MPERMFDDDRYYAHHTDSTGPNASTWLVPLLLLPIAFLGGWVANGYFEDAQFNRGIPGIETGVGGGPEEGNRGIISPLPTQEIAEPTVTVTPSPTPEISPTDTP